MFNMFSFLNIFIIALMLSINIKLSSAVLCYECNSVEDSECDSNPTQNKYKVDCADMQQLNSKIQIGSVEFSINNTQALASQSMRCFKVVLTDLSVESPTWRGCGIYPNGCVQLTQAMAQQGVGIEFCQSCNGDYCNSSSTISVGFYSLCSALFLILFTWK